MDKNTEILEEIGKSSVKVSATKIDYSGTYLFISFDLVNSTYFKNKTELWSSTFDKFFKQCSYEVKQRFDNIKVWKMIGDEILFYLPVSDVKILYEAPSKVFSVMQSTINIIHQREAESKGILYIKSTIWAANVVDIPTEEEENKGKRIEGQVKEDKDGEEKIKSLPQNIIIKDPSFDGGHKLDFLGQDIDIGFRISKYALQSKLVIDAKLACLLTKLETELDEDSISEKMRIVSYEKLKGVWDNRYYPIVWYHDDWQIDKMFIYDEEFNSDIVDNIKKKNILDPVSKLTKIFLDLNKIEEIENLREGIEAIKENLPGGFIQKNIPLDKLCELHLVGICVNDDNEILVAKRVKKDDLSELWEFGCSQLHLNQDVKEALKEGYMDDFSINIDFFEKEPTPIGYYTFHKKKEKNRIVPGFIFVVKVNKEELSLENIDKTKHTEVRWVSIDTYKSIDKKNCVPDFHKRIEDAYAYLKT